MHKLKIDPKLFVAMTYGTIVATALLYGCQSAQNPPAATGGASAGQPSFALFGPPPKKSGVELWGENCSRCHNIRPPNEFSGAQWAAIVHHMRFRANLTGEEEREITKFLQASN
jgi:cytochrome c5